MACAPEHDVQSTVPPSQVAERGGDKAAAELLLHHDLVCAAQDVGRVGIPVRKHTNGMPRGSGYRRRILALSADISDGDAPSRPCGIDVIEITAHVLRPRGRRVAGGDLDARDLA